MGSVSSPKPRRHTLRYLSFLFLRFLLACVGPSIIHPDEWLQSMQPMAFLLNRTGQSLADGAVQTSATTWDWKYSCYNSSIPAHSPLAARPSIIELPISQQQLQQANREHSIWRIDMAPSWMRCETGMQMQMPIRGVIAPWLSCGLPFQLFAATASSDIQLHPFLVLLPRITQFLYTCAMELMLFFVYQTVVRYLDHSGEKEGKSYSAGGSSRHHPGFFQFLSQYSASEFVIIVLLCRTFSNSQETFFLALLLFLASVRIRVLPPLVTRARVSWAHSLILACFDLVFGLLTAVAIWIRLTIVLFAWPVGVLLIYLHYRHQTNIAIKDDDDDGHNGRTGCGVFDHRTTSGRFMIGVRSCFAVAISTLIGIFIGSAFAVILDSLFYESVWICSSLVSESSAAASSLSQVACSSGIQSTLSRLLSLLKSHSAWAILQSLSFHGRLLVTPFTNYLYNSQAENVAHHGLHPLYTHLIVNWVLLFGPMSVFFLLRLTYQWLTGSSKLNARSSALRKQELTQPDSNIELQEPPAASRMKDGLSRRRPTAPASAGPASTSTTSATDDSNFVDNSDRNNEARHLFHSMLLVSFWSGMIGLSFIPHQEFRFLAPCFVPIMLLRALSPSSEDDISSPTTGKTTKVPPPRFKRFLQALNRIHRIVTIILLGILHQGGLLRNYMQVEVESQSLQASNASSSASYVTLHMYPTPQALVRLAASENAPVARQGVVEQIIDLHHPSQISPAVTRIVRNRMQTSRESGGDSYVNIIFTMPGSVDFPVQQMQETLRSLFTVDTPLSANDLSKRCRKQVCLIAKCTSVFPHLSLDEAPRPFDAFTHPPSGADVLYVDPGPTLRIHSSEIRCSGLTSRLSLMTYQWIIPAH